jgi:hypothetical protein
MGDELRPVDAAPLWALLDELRNKYKGERGGEARAFREFRERINSDDHLRALVSRYGLEMYKKTLR